MTDARPSVPPTEPSDATPATEPPTLPTPEATESASITESSSIAEDSAHVSPGEFVEQRRRPVGLIVTVSLLGVLLAAAIAAFVWYFLQLQDANAVIREQQRELEEQRELIDKKETFGAAMEGLLDEVGRYEGVPMATLIPWERYERLAAQSWARRWDAVALDASIADVDKARGELVTQRESAEREAASNASGSAYEATFDSLGSGYVTWVLEDADAFCEQDVIACVSSDDPLLVHVDTGDEQLPYTNDWLRTGTAYHEFAHVLQFTNPGPTATALEAFGGDSETMADCFALTFLDGWTLDHTIWVSSYEYWEVSTGYGYTCNASERQVIRDWFGELGVQLREISV